MAICTFWQVQLYLHPHTLFVFQPLRRCFPLWRKQPSDAQRTKTMCYTFSYPSILVCDAVQETSQTYIKTYIVFCVLQSMRTLSDLATEKETNALWSVCLSVELTKSELHLCSCLTHYQVVRFVWIQMCAQTADLSTLISLILWGGVRGEES